MNSYTRTPKTRRMLWIGFTALFVATASLTVEGQILRRGSPFKLFNNRNASNSSSPGSLQNSLNNVPRSKPVFNDRKSLALKSALMRLIPQDRHYRETLADAVTILYRSRKFRPLWNQREMPANLTTQLGDQLVRHGISRELVLNPDSISSNARGASVNQRDLGYTVAIADAGMLVKAGLVKGEVIWPEWDKGDRPGKDRLSAADVAQDLGSVINHKPFNTSTVVDTLAPRNWIYRELQNAYMESKRALDSGLQPIPNPSTAGVARPGARCSYAPELAEALAVKGYLRMLPRQRAGLTSITPELSAAIKSFQHAHGLDADGVVGNGTWIYLNYNPADRYKARLVNLHRARLLNDDLGERYVIVNLPSAELFGFEKDNQHSLTMRVVHGKANELNYHTPVFRDVMKEVVFAPYWNLPESISTKEVYPKILEDPTYLERNHYELVTRFTDDAEVFELNEDTLARIETGDMWLRQRPKGGNALGKVKFLLPNQFHIYLHDTPSKHYFKLDDRDHSHGCIRLAEPATMASWALAAEGWDDQQIYEAMEADNQSRAKLKNPINIYITYFTSLPRPSGVNTGKFVLTAERDVYYLDSNAYRSLAEKLP